MNTTDLINDPDYPVQFKLTIVCYADAYGQADWHQQSDHNEPKPNYVVGWIVKEQDSFIVLTSCIDPLQPDGHPWEKGPRCFHSITIPKQCIVYRNDLSGAVPYADEETPISQTRSKKELNKSVLNNPCLLYYNDCQYLFNHDIVVSQGLCPGDTLNKFEYAKLKSEHRNLSKLWVYCGPIDPNSFYVINDDMVFSVPPDVAIQADLSMDLNHVDDAKLKELYKLAADTADGKIRRIY